MSVAAVLVWLYPAALRDRWGTALRDDAEASGWRSWPNLLAGAADAWLHPLIWPAPSTGQRRRRAAALAITVMSVSWLVGHAVSEMLLPSDIAHAWPLATGDLLTVLGLALLVPLPRFTLVAVMAVARRAVRQLAVPAALGLCVVLVVHAINGSTLPATVRVALLICWWAALTVGTVQICRVVAGLEADAVVPPGPSRLRAGIWVLAVALAIPASVLVGSSALAGRILPALAGAGLLLLTLILGCTLRDLRQVPVAD